MTFARGGGGGARGAWRASGEQHLPALRVIVAVGGGAQLFDLLAPRAHRALAILVLHRSPSIWQQPGYN